MHWVMVTILKILLEMSLSSSCFSSSFLCSFSFIDYFTVIACTRMDYVWRTSLTNEQHDSQSPVYAVEDTNRGFWSCNSSSNYGYFSQSFLNFKFFCVLFICRSQPSLLQILDMLLTCYPKLRGSVERNYYCQFFLFYCPFVRIWKREGRFSRWTNE